MQVEPDSDAVPSESRLVLVVDDDPDLLELTRFVLENEGIVVETATNGEDALEVLRAGARPGLVLLDLMMPVMNGWMFLDEIAKIPSFKAIPVVVFTAAQPKGVPGAVEVLRKPIDILSLLAAVARHTGGPGPG
jgi:CheY-like chemotaxis protein